MYTSLKLEWKIEYGLSRGKMVSCWFPFSHPEIGKLCKKHRAKVVDRR